MSNGDGNTGYGGVGYRMHFFQFFKSRNLFIPTHRSSHSQAWSPLSSTSQGFLSSFSFSFFRAIYFLFLFLFLLNLTHACIHSPHRYSILEEQRLGNCPTLLLINKLDAEGSQPYTEVRGMIDESRLKGRRFAIAGCSTNDRASIAKAFEDFANENFETVSDLLQSQ